MNVMVLFLFTYVKNMYYMYNYYICTSPSLSLSLSLSLTIIFLIKGHREQSESILPVIVGQWIVCRPQVAPIATVYKKEKSWMIQNVRGYTHRDPPCPSLCPIVPQDCK